MNPGSLAIFNSWEPDGFGVVYLSVRTVSFQVVLSVEERRTTCPDPARVAPLHLLK